MKGYTPCRRLVLKSNVTGGFVYRNIANPSRGGVCDVDRLGVWVGKNSSERGCGEARIGARREVDRCIKTWYHPIKITLVPFAVSWFNHSGD